MGNVSVDGKTLWLSGRYDNVVYAINTTIGEVTKIPVGTEPHGLTVWPQPGRYSLGHTGNMRVVARTQPASTDGVIATTQLTPVRSTGCRAEPGERVRRSVHAAGSPGSQRRRRALLGEAGAGELARRRAAA